MHSYRLTFLPVCSILSLSELCYLDPRLPAPALVDVDSPTLSPLPRSLGKLAVCALAALSREIPPRIFLSLFHTLFSRMEGEDGTRLLRISNLGNVQVLLLLGVSSELHALTTNQGGSFSWLTVGSAIRMALDIVRIIFTLCMRMADDRCQGLHRDIAGDQVSLQQVDRRRRVWASCVIADRWYALSFGQPMTINLLDCDAHGPSVYADGCRDGQSDSEAPFTMHAEMTKVGSRGALLMLVHPDTRFKQLSILLGRVRECPHCHQTSELTPPSVRAAYRPLGMDLITDSTLRQLQEDIEQWHSNLPATLRLRTERNSDPKAGLLCLFSVCVDFVFVSLPICCP